MQINLQIAASVLMLLVGVYLATRFVRDTILGIRSKSWPYVSGKISMADFEHDFDSNTYSTNISYQYIVDGRELFGNCVSFGDRVGFIRQKAVQKYLKNYSEGAVVNVSYCPINPNLSVLSPGLTTKILWTLTYALFLFIMGAGTLSNALQKI